MITLRPLRTLTCLLAFPLAAAAQTTYTAKHIVFKNPGTFTQAQLEAVSGMHPGSPTNATTMSAAAQKLADTGYFDDIKCQLDGGASDVSVVFSLKPIDKANMIRVGFENFVWMTPAEINAAILAKFPLYIGYLPENSPAIDTITAALTEALAAKGITATVDHDTHEPTLAHPFRDLQFLVASPLIVVANVHLSGVSPEIVPLIQKSVNATAHKAYSEGPSNYVTAEAILAPLLDAGYVEAALSDVSLAPSPVVNRKVDLVITATLHAGEVYKVSSITFAGSPLYSAAEFAAAQKLHGGDVASRKAMLEMLAPLDAAYRRQGYADIIVNATPTFDEVTHQVAYNVSVEPGAQYRVNQITASGLDPAAQRDYDKYFLMKSGDLFNPEYVSTFIVNNSALASLRSYTAGWRAYADPNTHLVDLVVTFSRGGTGKTQSISVH